MADDAERRMLAECDLDSLLLKPRDAIVPPLDSGDPHTRQFAQAAVDLQNKYREVHGAAPLTISRELSLVSQDWAEELAGNRRRMMHRLNCPVGENICCQEGASLADMDPAEFVWMWYKEIRLFDWDIYNWQNGTAHFSQLVWKDTELVGVGVSWVDGLAMLVCNYYHRGNTFNKFTDNVQRLDSDAIVRISNC